MITRRQYGPRWIEPPIKLCERDRSSAGSAILFPVARRNGTPRASASWSKKPARWHWLASRTAASTVDRVQIQQVLLNLIRNSMDAMETSQVRDLKITLAATDNGFIRISVIDSGSGIAPEVAKQLFQPFVTTKRDGMGVGLSISRTIVEAHGGQIWVEQNPSGGTIFHFTLPAIAEGDVDRAT
jgi:signal transduction histidine kinase